MQQPPCLFVYGTLRRGFENQYARLLHANALFLGAAKMQGRLLQFGEYTGAVISDRPDDWIAGELFELIDPKILDSLDAYEGLDYERVLATASLEDGAERDTWVYLLRRR
ncbi:MAG TPA: gamma-glutamylcyclotransferase family protein [Bryobacteraceae bacterium]|nr:gamma-glutamylcyclotransferase family protein [Bryobacteraceae bacterium]